MGLSDGRSPNSFWNIPTDRTKVDRSGLQWDGSSAIVGFEDDRIHYELFANSAEDAEKILEKSQQRIATYGEKQTSTVNVKHDNRSLRFELATWCNANIHSWHDGKIVRRP